MAIFVPEKINVGFQERKGTYTGKLAYIIYFDEKGKIRKEASWNGWRDEKIDNIIHENIPTEGFVLNKKVGGYSSGWNHRQTYTRVYDPRGFEFEINVDNLLYILENTNSIKGKGLEGEFVYGWDGKDLILIPTGSPDYIEIEKYSNVLKNKEHIKSKDLKVGATYLSKDNETYAYLGKFDEYDWHGVKKKGKSFWFYNTKETKNSWESPILAVRGLGQKFISCISEDCVENYAEMFEKMESKSSYSPVDDSKNEYIYYTLEYLKEYFASSGRWGRKTIYLEKGEKGVTLTKGDNCYYYQVDNPNYDYHVWTSREPRYLEVKFASLEEVVLELKPMYLSKYLANGKLYSEGK